MSGLTASVLLVFPDFVVLVVVVGSVFFCDGVDLVVLLLLSSLLLCLFYAPVALVPVLVMIIVLVNRLGVGGRRWC